MTNLTSSSNNITTTNNSKTMTINLPLIRVRKFNQAVVATAIKNANRINRQLAVIDSKLEVVRNFRVVSNTKTRKSDSRKVAAKQPKVRTGVKPVRLTVKHTPVVASKSLRSFGAVVVRSRACFAETIALNTIIPTQFFMEAKSMLDNTKSNLPAVAQSMVMSADIDAEFGIDPTNPNTSKPVGDNNMNEINMNEVSAEVALNALRIANVNNEVPAIQSPIEVLAEATIADGWVVLSDKERDLLSETNQLGFREVKTSPKAWELLTSSNLGIIKGSFAGKVETLYSKGLPGVNALEAIYGKHCFDEGPALDIVDGVFHTIHKQGNLVVEIAVDFNKGKLCYVAKHTKLGNVAVEPTVKDLRKFAIINFFSANQKANVRGLYSVENAVRLFIELVRTCWTVNHFNFLIAGMTSKLFIDTTEQQFRRSGRGYGVREFSTDLDELSREQIIEAHKISIIPTACMIQKPGVIFAKTTVDAKLDGTEFETCFNFFNKFNEPVIIDKQAKKWLAYGNGARASFVDYDGTSLVSANPTDKTAKFLNRISSHSFKQASNQRATFKGMDEFSGQYVRSNLQIALKDAKTCFIEGVDLPAFVSFGDFALNAGTIETNVLKDVKL